MKVVICIYGMCVIWNFGIIIGLVFFKECQFNCLPALTSLDSRKYDNFSGGPCNLDNTMLRVSRLHNLTAFSTLCAQDVNSLLLLPSSILMKFSMECCKAWVYRPKI